MVTEPDISVNRKKIIRIYLQNVHRKKPDTEGYNISHDGKEGYWLERQMGISPNRKNEADLFDHEMKNYTTGKTSYGDWSADYYVFKDEKYNISRDDFLKIFGHPNPS